MVLFPSFAKVNESPFYGRISYLVSFKKSATVLPKTLKIKVNNQNFSALHCLPASKVGKYRTAPHSPLVRVEGYELS